MPYFARMRRCYFIVARGSQDAYGFTIEDVYFLTPNMLEGWIQPFEQRIQADMQLVEGVIVVLMEAGFRGDLDRLRALCARGLTINNPKIGWRYIQTQGVRLGDPPALRLRELVAAHPLPSG